MPTGEEAQPANNAIMATHNEHRWNWNMTTAHRGELLGRKHVLNANVNPGQEPPRTDGPSAPRPAAPTGTTASSHTQLCSKDATIPPAESRAGTAHRSVPTVAQRVGGSSKAFFRLAWRCGTKNSRWKNVSPSNPDFLKCNCRRTMAGLDRVLPSPICRPPSFLAKELPSTGELDFMGSSMELRQGKSI